MYVVRLKEGLCWILMMQLMKAWIRELLNMCFPLTVCLFHLCSISSERPEACQHCAAPWHHPHQGNPDSGLRICGEAAHCHADISWLDPLWVSFRGWKYGLKSCSKRKESTWLEKATEVSSPFSDWFDLSHVSYFNTLLTETQAVDALISMLLFIGP